MHMYIPHNLFINESHGCYLTSPKTPLALDGSIIPLHTMMTVSEEDKLVRCQPLLCYVLCYKVHSDITPEKPCIRNSTESISIPAQLYCIQSCMCNIFHYYSTVSLHKH